MESYKEFTGKSLDEAMAAACNYFGLERGKLEIEILSDAKSGIFGLVGAKKATVRARKANIDALNLKVGAKEGDKKPQAKNNNAKPRGEKPAKSEAPAPKAESAPAQEQAAPSAPERDAAPEQESAPKPVPRAKQRQENRQSDRQEESTETRAENRPENRHDNRADKRQGGRGRDRERGNGEKNARPPRQERPKQTRPKQARPDKPVSDGIEEKFPEVPLESMDRALLEAEVLNAVDSMTRHIVGETDKEFEISGDKARVRINSGEDSGLLIGRDGQTLSALQYLASCIVSRRLNASVRVQIDTGDYRSRQLEKLRATALELADKVRETGRPQSTRPMSAYLRRVVHMALQEDPDVQTHSKGEGSLKRVVIVAKKK